MSPVTTRASCPFFLFLILSAFYRGDFVGGNAPAVGTPVSISPAQVWAAADRTIIPAEKSRTEGTEIQDRSVSSAEGTGIQDRSISSAEGTGSREEQTAPRRKPAPEGAASASPRPRDEDHGAHGRRPAVSPREASSGATSPSSGYVAVPGSSSATDSASAPGSSSATDSTQLTPQLIPRPLKPTSSKHSPTSAQQAGDEHDAHLQTGTDGAHLQTGAGGRGTTDGGTHRSGDGVDAHRGAADAHQTADASLQTGGATTDAAHHTGGATTDAAHHTGGATTDAAQATSQHTSQTTSQQTGRGPFAGHASWIRGDTSTRPKPKAKSPLTEAQQKRFAAQKLEELRREKVRIDSLNEEYMRYHRLESAARRRRLIMGTARSGGNGTNAVNRAENEIWDELGMGGGRQMGDGDGERVWGRYSLTTAIGSCFVVKID